MPPTRNPQESISRSELRNHEFALVLHWVGVALLAYFLADLAFQAWPVALLKPMWLDQMSGFLVSRSTTPLPGALFVAAASELDPRQHLSLNGQHCYDDWPRGWRLAISS